MSWAPVRCAVLTEAPLAVVGGVEMWREARSSVDRA
jgi:hypothetical protein